MAHEVSLTLFATILGFPNLLEDRSICQSSQNLTLDRNAWLNNQVLVSELQYTRIA